MSQTTFKLLGTTGPVFRVVREYKAAGFIPSYVGVSLCGKRQTVARVADVEIIEGKSNA